MRYVVVRAILRTQRPPGSLRRQIWPVLMLSNETDRITTAGLSGQAMNSPSKQRFEPPYPSLCVMYVDTGVLIRREAAGSPCKYRWRCSAFRFFNSDKLNFSVSCPVGASGTCFPNHWSRNGSKMVEEDNLWHQAFDTYTPLWVNFQFSGKAWRDYPAKLKQINHLQIGEYIADKLQGQWCYNIELHFLAAG